MSTEISLQDLEVISSVLAGEHEAEDIAQQVSDLNLATFTDSELTQSATVVEHGDPLWFGDLDESGAPIGSGVEMGRGDEFTGLSVKHNGRSFYQVGVWEGKPCMLLYGPDGSLQRVDSAEDSTWYTYDDAGKRFVSVRVRDGEIQLYDPSQGSDYPSLRMVGGWLQTYDAATGAATMQIREGVITVFTTAATSGKYTRLSSFSAMASLDGTADKPVPSVEIANGLIKVYDNAGNVRQQLEGGTTLGLLTLRDSYLDVLRADGVRFAWAVGLSGESGRRTLCTANGRIYFSDGTGDPVQQSSSPYLDYGGEANRLLIARGGLGTDASPAYIRPPKASATGISPTNATMDNTGFKTVFSLSLTTAQTCDILVSAGFRSTLTLGATRNEAMRVRVRVDGVQVGTYRSYAGSTGNLVSPQVNVTAANIAAGSHTVTVEAFMTNSGDTATVAFVDMDAEARLS
ncbi:MAG: hypothetical protein M3P51_09110 [Chloroflexota bacterium]|nr:hypothetical protein [Chloroflexota bacterium]